VKALHCVLLLILSILFFVSDSVDAGQSGADGRLLIVAPKQFQKDLKPFVAQKRQVIPVEVATLESVLAKQSGADDPEKLKHFLYEAWRQRQVRYVLLVGDASLMPVRYMVLDRVTPAAFDYAFYPSDLYYADVAKPDGSFEDWNARKDDFHGLYYGEVRGEKNKTDPINFDAVDYRPELAVGRWPVGSTEQLKIVAAKSISYQRQLAARTPGSVKAGLIAVGGWVDSRGLLEQIAAALPKTWTVEKRYYQDAASPGSTPPPTAEEVLKLLNSGTDLIFHTGHGTDMGWDQCLGTHMIPQMHNADRPPIVFSAGCSTARFATLPPYEPYIDLHGQKHKGSDHGEVFTAPPPPPACYQKGRFNPPGLGKQLLVAGPQGAVAYIGCNTGAPPCDLILLQGFAQSCAQTPTARLGDCWNGALRFYYDQEHLAMIKPNAGWYPPSIFFQGMKFMLYGDPTLPMPR
jgi:hypothetical protein